MHKMFSIQSEKKTASNNSVARTNGRDRPPEEGHFEHPFFFEGYEVWSLKITKHCSLTERDIKSNIYIYNSVVITKIIY